MLEPLRNQFIVELAERYTSQGYGVIYLVANAWRGAEVEDTGINATVIACRRGWLVQLKQQIDCIEDEGSKALVVTEGSLRGLVVHDHHILIPRAVVTLDPVRCPHCGKHVFASWYEVDTHLVARCRPRTHQRWQQSLHPTISPPEGKGRGRYARKGHALGHRKQLWTDKQEALARELRAQGLTFAQIGARMGRSAPSVTLFLRRDGMEGTRKRQQRRHAIASLDDQMEALMLQQ